MRNRLDLDGSSRCDGRFFEKVESADLIISYLFINDCFCNILQKESCTASRAGYSKSDILLSDLLTDNIMFLKFKTEKRGKNS